MSYRNISESKQALYHSPSYMNPSRAFQTSMKLFWKIKDYVLSESPSLNTNVKNYLISHDQHYLKVPHLMGSSYVRNKCGRNSIEKRICLMKQTRQLNTSTHAYGKRASLRGNVQTSKTIRDRFMPPNKISDITRTQRQLDERFTVTPRTISLKPKKRSYPETSISQAWTKNTIPDNLLSQQRQKVPMSFTQKAVMKKEVEQLRPRKVRRKLTQEDLVPQMFPRTSLQMRKSFLPIEPCKRVDLAERKQEKVQKSKEPQQTGIISTMKNFIKATFKRY